MNTIRQVISRLKRTEVSKLAGPRYTNEGGHNTKIALAVKDMQNHVTDEGWQLMLGLQQGGYDLWGKGIGAHKIPLHNDIYPEGCTDVNSIIKLVEPDVVVVQDKREWDPRSVNHRDTSYGFINYRTLTDRDDIFKVTILKDAHQNPLYHKQAAEEIGCHAWIVYYHPSIINHLAPYTRRQHLIRTYHTIDPDKVPEYTQRRYGTILSGAVSSHYPLRQRLIANINRLPQTTYMKHPGYNTGTCSTNDYLKMLSQFKVSICTCSIYGYSLRKIIESMACGCKVITDLPTDDILPGGIDDNLYRIRPDINLDELGKLIQGLVNEYDPEEQAVYAKRVKAYYDYKVSGVRLAEDIEHMRSTYQCT